MLGYGTCAHFVQVPSTEEGNDFEVEDTEPITVSCVVSGSPAEVH